MNKPVRKSGDHLPPSLAERLRPAVESGQFEGVGEAEFVATGALADRLEFGATDDVEAIRRSIERSIAEDDYEDAEQVFARLRARYEEPGD